MPLYYGRWQSFFLLLFDNLYYSVRNSVCHGRLCVTLWKSQHSIINRNSYKLNISHSNFRPINLTPIEWRKTQSNVRWQKNKTWCSGNTWSNRTDRLLTSSSRLWQQKSKQMWNNRYDRSAPPDTVFSRKYRWKSNNSWPLRLNEWLFCTRAI